MASEHLYFYEDEVFRLNKKGNLELGMVLQNSEHLSSDDEDEESYEPLVRKGYIRVAWHPSGVEEVLPEKRVGLADRSLMPGDVVRRLIKGKDTQRGYCRNINVKACLQVVASNKVIQDVNSRDLKPVEKFAQNVVVVYKSWVGTVRHVSTKLHLSLSDGSQCTIKDIEAEDLDDMDVRGGEFPHRNDFHPGQVLLGTSHDLSNAHWIVPSKDVKAKTSKLLKMLVQDVVIEAVTVTWQCYTYSTNADSVTQPDSVIQGEELKNLHPLNVFESCTLQIGDRSFYDVKESDQIIAKEMWRFRQEGVLFSRKFHWKRKGLDNGKLKPETADKSDSKSPDIEPQKSGNEGWETDDGDSVSVSSGCSSNSSASKGGGSGGGQKKKKNPGLMTKMLKYKKLRRTRRNPPNVVVKPDAQVVVETLMTCSCADVVWQDGSVELGIASTQLYPIHHLDDQEFFPGDFVVENKENGCTRVYGVVQSVDHVGRLAKVTWFHTYTSHKELEPKRLDTVEVSVYDLKDHPDFQYRPGTVALRVANFDLDNGACTVGQVLDNYPEGRVHMWWVDGHTSMCWPQDLYKVGDYDSDEGELWDDNASEGSWETESEEEEALDASIKPKLASTIEKARASMATLEELFTLNPYAQTVYIMQRLLEFYRDCRYLDKLMGTSYFHEEHFQGLVEKVREKNRTSIVGQRMQDQVSRLSAPVTCVDPDVPCIEPIPSVNSSLVVNSSLDESQVAERVNVALESLEVCLEQNIALSKSVSSEDDEKSPNSLNGGMLAQSSSQDDSGVFEHSAVSADASSSENCDCYPKEPSTTEPRKGTFIFGALGSRASYGGCEKRASMRITKHAATASLPGHQQTDTDDPNPCAKLCALIKAQLCLAHDEVFQRFHEGSVPPRLSEVEKQIPDEEMIESPSPASCPDDPLIPQICVEDGGFEVLSAVSTSHKFKLALCQNPGPAFLKTVRRELSLLRNSLPAGIWVKGFEDRMDLYTMMIRGPEKTPYEDGLFLFDVQLPTNYPSSPPIFHYHSYCSDRLNPNLYEDGKVCVSLLGTWKGRGTEVWNVYSTLLQVIVSIQGLILVKEPYYNEAGYEKQKGSQQGHENSRMYNEMAILKLVQAMTKLCQFPHPDFRNEIKEHFAKNSPRMLTRLEKWLDISETYNQNVPPSPGEMPVERDAAERNQHWERSEINQRSLGYQPDFPLLPASRGFCITMRKTLNGFRDVCNS